MGPIAVAPHLAPFSGPPVTAAAGQGECYGVGGGGRKPVDLGYRMYIAMMGPTASARDAGRDPNAKYMAARLRDLSGLYTGSAG